MTDTIFEPPWSEQSEKVLLGADMIDDAFARFIRPMVPVEAFYSQIHQDICQSVYDLVDHGTVVDAVSLSEELKAQGKFERAGGAAYLDQLVDAVPFNCLVSGSPERDGHAEIVLRLWRGRQSSQLAQRAIASYQKRDSTNTELAAGLSSAAAAAVPKIETVERGDSLLVLLQQDPATRPVRLRVAGRTDAEDLGSILGPIWPGQILVVAGDTSVGKTAAMATWMLSTALGGVPSAYITIEDSQAELEARVAANLTWIETWRILENAYRKEADPERVEATALALKSVPMWIDWIPGASASDVGIAIRQQIHRNKVRLVAVDYLQKMGGGNERRSRSEQIDAAMREIFAALGKDAACMVGSQITREGKKAGRPTKHDLRESGNIEDRARKIILLSDGNRVENAEDGKQYRREVVMDIVKNTNRGLCEVRGWFHVRQSCVWPGWERPPHAPIGEPLPPAPEPEQSPLTWDPEENY